MAAANIRLTPSNARIYIGCDIAFNSRGSRVVCKLLKVSDSGKTVYIDHDDLGGNLVIEKRVVNVILPKKALPIDAKDVRIATLEARVKELESALLALTTATATATDDDDIGNLPEFIHYD